MNVAETKEDVVIHVLTVLALFLVHVILVTSWIETDFLALVHTSGNTFVVMYINTN